MSPQVLGTAAVARISAQARAPSESTVLLPGMVAKPLFSTRLPRSQLLLLMRASAFTTGSGCARKRSTQIGARAATTASCEAEALFLAAVPPVPQPPQLKPTMASTIAPPTAPWIQGLVLVGIFMGSPFHGRRAAIPHRPRDRRAQRRVAEKQEQGGRYQPVPGTTMAIVRANPS